VNVQEDAETVADALAESKTGFASFEQASRQGGKIWVNLAQVRAIREATGSGGAATASLEDDEDL
jgi:hypothetical protein